VIFAKAGLFTSGAFRYQGAMGHSTHRRSGRRAALIALGLMGAAGMLAADAALAKMRREVLTLVTSAGDRPIDIEIAESNEQKALGLMFRPTVPENTGMLFPYGDPQEITMWMKNTYASLDMVFIRADGVVHRIAARTEPLSEAIVASEGKVSAVLELAAGASERLGLKPGDLVRHKIFKTAK
jgi:uncharacterized protein